MRMLLIDFRAARQSLFLVDGRKRRRLSSLPQFGGFPLLGRAISAWGLRRRPPEAIGVARLSGADRPTWSALRGAAALANSASLAWNAPLFTLDLKGEETDAELESQMTEVKKTAATWFRPEYGGEPHITRPRDAAAI